MHGRCRPIVVDFLLAFSLGLIILAASAGSHTGCARHGQHSEKPKAESPESPEARGADKDQCSSDWRAHGNSRLRCRFA